MGLFATRWIFFIDITSNVIPSSQRPSPCKEKSGRRFIRDQRLTNFSQGNSERVRLDLTQPFPFSPFGSRQQEGRQAAGLFNGREREVSFPLNPIALPSFPILLGNGEGEALRGDVTWPGHLFVWLFGHRFLQNRPRISFRGYFFFLFPFLHP